MQDPIRSCRCLALALLRVTLTPILPMSPRPQSAQSSSPSTHLVEGLLRGSQGQATGPRPQSQDPRPAGPQSPGQAQRAGGRESTNQITVAFPAPTTRPPSVLGRASTVPPPGQCREGGVDTWADLPEDSCTCWSSGGQGGAGGHTAQTACWLCHL